MKKHLFFITLLVLLVILSHWNWYFNTQVLSWGDFHATLFQRDKELLAFPFVWETTLGFGSLFVTLSFWPFLFIAGLISQTGISGPAIERIIYFWPMGILTAVTMYILSYHIFRSKTAAFISAIIFEFNVYITLLQVGGIITESMATSLAPLLFLFFMLTLEKKKIIYALLTTLVAFVIGFYEFRILYIFLWILFFYLFFHLLFFENFKKIIGNVLHIGVLLFIFLILIVSLNMYWLLPLSNIGAISHNAIFDTQLFGQQFVNIAVSITTFLYYWTGAKPAIFVLEPIPFYFWLVPIFAFLGLLYIKKNKKVLFFSFVALLGIFLTKQDAGPFPNDYQWLFYHLPGFNAFRESTKFYTYTDFGYALLTAAFTCLLIDWSKKLKKKKIIITPLIMGIIFVSLWNIKPLITKEVGRIELTTEIPSQYAQLNQILANDKSFSRTLSTPDVQRFTFFSDIHPDIRFLNIPDTQKPLNEKLLSLENIKYIILPYDATNDIYTYTSSQTSYLRYIQTALLSDNPFSRGNVNFFQNLTGIQIWKNSAIDPHIMPVKDLVYVTGDADIKRIIAIPTDPQVAYFFEDTLSSDASLRNSVMLTNANKIYASASCIRCDPTKTYYDDVLVPYASFLPDSPLYQLILRKEKATLNSILDPQQKIEQEALLSEKRIVEIQGMIDDNVDSQYIIKTILSNNILLSDIENYVSLNQTNDKIQNNTKFLTIYDYLSLERRQILNFMSQAQDDTVNQLLNQSIYRLNNDIDKLSGILWIANDNDKKLVISIPQQGQYSVYVKNDPTINFANSNFFVDGEKITLPSPQNNYSVLNGLTLSSGSHPFEMQIDSTNLVPTTSLQLNLKNNSLESKVSLPVKNYNDPYSEYEVSFDYQIAKKAILKVFVSDDAGVKNQVTDANIYTLDNTMEGDGSDSWQQSDTFIVPHYGTSIANLNFWLSRNDSLVDGAQIKNLKFVKIVDPDIVFVKDNKTSLFMPQINFQEVNEDDYNVHISNATAPFFLAFSEGFDPNWKAYYTQENTPENSVVARYFGNSVIEQAYADKPDVSFLLHILKMIPVPEQNHASIDSFGNGWLIDKPGNYTIRLVYKPEAYAIIGTFITVGAVVILIAGIGFFLIKERGKKK